MGNETATENEMASEMASEIDDASRIVGCVGAILCAIIGAVSNGLTMWVIVKVLKLKNA